MTTYENATFATYVYKVLKAIHADTGMSGDGLAEINNIIKFVINRTMRGINDLILKSKRKTISSREVQTAFRLFLPSSISPIVIEYATKAVNTYTESKDTAAKESSRRKEAGEGKMPPVSRASMADIKFPITRIETIMMELATVDRKTDGSAVFFAASIESIVSYILERSSAIAHENKKMRITPRHIIFAITGDEDLKKMFQSTVMSGGVVPHIEPKLLSKRVVTHHAKAKSSTAQPKASTKAKTPAKASTSAKSKAKGSTAKAKTNAKSKAKTSAKSKSK